MPTQTKMLTNFTKFLASEGRDVTLSQFSPETVRAFIVDQQEKHLSPFTVQSKVRALKAFSSWLLAERYTSDNALNNVKLPKAPVKLIEPLTTDEMVSLEHLMKKDDRLDTVEDALARHKRRGAMLKSTEDSAVARVMDYELRKSLTPRQEQVLELRLQQYSESEIAAVLGITQESVSNLVIHIRVKAAETGGISHLHRLG